CAGTRARGALGSTGMGGFEVELVADESEVDVAARDETAVVADFDDEALVHDHDLIGVAHRAQAVSDYDDRAAGSEVSEIGKHGAFVVRLKGAGGFVEEQKLGIV